jgi:hypothetical protein
MIMTMSSQQWMEPTVLKSVHFNLLNQQRVPPTLTYKTVEHSTHYFVPIL